MSILDIGCAEGALGARLKESRQCTVVGLEISDHYARIASQRLDEVIVGPAENSIAKFIADGRKFDCIVCADVLEHMADPWDVLRSTRELLSNGGVVVVSLPNIAHLSTVLGLLFHQSFEYRDRGILDRTHLRFFGQSDLSDLFQKCGFEEVRRVRRHRILERPHRLNDLTEGMVSVIPIVSNLTTYQVLSVLRPASQP